MQDKEILDQSEEALTTVGENNGKKGDPIKERKESEEEPGRKEQTKDSKFAFRKMRQPKKEKVDKKSAQRFNGEGVSFKAKLIGVENVSDARGDKICQEAMCKLKMNVKNLGPHKRKIIIYVSLQGIKIRDEKTSELLHHNPVAHISFISQDVSDARAFGYVAGSADGQHRFIAIKTEKPAFHVVLALRDLFQTVLNLKQEKMEQAKEKKVDEPDTVSSVGSDSLNEKTSVQDHSTDSSSKEEEAEEEEEEEEKNIKEENVYFDVILAVPFTMKDPDIAFNPISKAKEAKSVDDLLCLQDELNKLQQGIEQMDTSIAAATYSFGPDPVGKDPFDTSFLTPGGQKIDVFPQPMPAPVPVTAATKSSTSPQTDQTLSQALYEDKYAAFSTLSDEPSIFESALSKEASENQVAASGSEDSGAAVPDLNDLEEEIKRKSVAPSKPPRNVKPQAADLSVFADLDPLGKDRPYKDKTEFFQDVKNPPKKVLNDLLDKSSCEDTAARPFDVHAGSPPVAFPLSPPELASPHKHCLASSLPNSFLSNLKFSAFSQNGSTSPFNPFENDSNHSSCNTSPPNEMATNSFSHLPSTSAPIVSSNQKFSFNPKSEIIMSKHDSVSSSPIPIPMTQQPFLDHRERALSNGSTGSSSSRSPCRMDSPSYMNQVDNGGASPDRQKLTNGCDNSNREIQSNACSELTFNGTSNSAKGMTSPANAINNATSKHSNTQNGVSRPRPRSSLSKGNSLPSNGITLPHLPSNALSPESEAISRENMQSIANMLRANGHRTRAASLPVENQRDFSRIPYPAEKNIFAKKMDPFGDDFFCSLPKKAPNHLVASEIREYV